MTGQARLSRGRIVIRILALALAATFVSAVSGVSSTARATLPAAAASRKFVALSVNVVQPKVALGTGALIRAVAVDVNGRRIDVNRTVEWTRHGTAVKRPRRSGIAATRHVGSAVLIGRLGDLSSEPVRVTVSPRRPRSLAITPAIEAPLGREGRIAVIADFGGWTQDVRRWARFTQFDRRIASIRRGRVQPSSPGHTSVVARFQGKMSNAADVEVPLFHADYESGLGSSGVPGLVAHGGVAASDAARVTRGGARYGDWSIEHKVVLGDPAYTSAGAFRSESATDRVPSTWYAPGDRRVYGFSLKLADWDRWTGPATPIDIVWQFKRFGQRPDMFIGVRKNQLVLRYGTTASVPLIDDVSAIVDRWLDVRISVHWDYQSRGYASVQLRRPDESAFETVFTAAGISTMGPPSGGGDRGYLKWGLYRPDSSLRQGDPAVRRVWHDDITVTLPVEAVP